MSLNQIAIGLADDVQDWDHTRAHWQAKLIEAFHAVENGSTDPFAGDNDPDEWPVPDYIRRDFAQRCEQGKYVLEPDSGLVWNVKDGEDVATLYAIDGYNMNIYVLEHLRQHYGAVVNRREQLINDIYSDLQNLISGFEDYMSENYGVDLDDLDVCDQVADFAYDQIDAEALLTFVEDDITPDLFKQWALAYDKEQDRKITDQWRILYGNHYEYI